MSVEELALLPTILASACRRPGAYPLSALLPDDVEVMLTPRCATTGRALRAMLSGKGTATERPFRLVPTQHERQALAEVTALAKRYRLDPVLVATDVDDAADQVLELRAAERLGVTALEVSCAAFSRWGRSLTEHRDEQLGDDYETERAQRSARGHVTRRLLDELADHIASKAKTTTKTTAAPRAAKRG